MNTTLSALSLHVTELEEKIDKCNPSPQQMEFPIPYDNLSGEDLVEAFVRLSGYRRKVVLEILSNRPNTEEVLSSLINRVFADMLARNQTRSVRLSEIKDLVSNGRSRELKTLLTFVESTLKQETKKN